MAYSKFKVFLAALISCVVLTGYQAPLIEKTFTKLAVPSPIPQSIEDSAESLQQKVENFKIYAQSALFDHMAFNSEQAAPVVSVSGPLVFKEPAPALSNTPSAVVAPPLKNCSISKCKVLLIGDSVMGDIAFAVQRQVKKEKLPWDVIDAHKVSSGLTVSSYYNWPETAKVLTAKHTPDVAFMIIGANDVQDMHLKQQWSKFASPLWEETYLDRVHQIATAFNAYTKSWYFIEIPVMKDKTFNEKISYVRSLQKKAAKDENYVPTFEIFGDPATPEKANLKLRAGDGIHLNSKGSDALAKVLISKLKSYGY